MEAQWMMTDSQGSVIVSSLGWVDHGSLWIMSVGSGRTETVLLSEAKYLSLHPGTDDFFSVNHHFDSDRARITIHRYSDPREVAASANLTPEGSALDGDLSLWSFVQKNYVSYYAGPYWKDFCLLQVAQQVRRLELQQLDWYSDGYDKGYQGIIGVVEVPDDDLLIISVQRDSHPVLYDPRVRKKVGTLELCNRSGNPNLFFRRRASELWADDYDTVVKLEPVTWRVLGSKLLQPAMAGARQFIGKFSFDAEESLCVVARPFSRDVIGLDPTTLQMRFRCDLDGQPIVAVALPDGSVNARDWKSGALLRGHWQASP
jgi:hypothetical protein